MRGMAVPFGRIRGGGIGESGQARGAELRAEQQRQPQGRGQIQGHQGQRTGAAAKAGVIALTRTAGKELGKFHITCNAIVPGFIKTEMTANVPEKAKEIMVSKLSLGEMGTPEDVGNMVAFLASDDASHMTQGIYNVDGGMVL